MRGSSFIVNENLDLVRRRSAPAPASRLPYARPAAAPASRERAILPLPCAPDCLRPQFLPPVHGDGTNLQHPPQSSPPPLQLHLLRPPCAFRAALPPCARLSSICSAPSSSISSAPASSMEAGRRGGSSRGSARNESIGRTPTVDQRESPPCSSLSPTQAVAQEFVNPWPGSGATSSPNFWYERNPSFWFLQNYSSSIVTCHNP